MQMLLELDCIIAGMEPRTGGIWRTSENIRNQRTSRLVAVSQRSTWNANVLDCAFTRQRLRQRWPRSDDLPGEVDCGRNARGHVVVKLSNEAYYPRRCGDRRGRPPVEKRMEGSAHAPTLHLSTPPATPTITTGLRGVPPGAGDDASHPTRTTPAPQIAPS
jgi:hypothetical protein